MSFDMSGEKIASASTKVWSSEISMLSMYFTFDREQWFEFIVFSMAHVCLNFVVDFDGKSFIFALLYDELCIYFLVSDLQQSIHWHSVPMPRFWQRQAIQELFIYFDWPIQQQGSIDIHESSIVKFKFISLVAQKGQTHGWIRLVEC